MTITIPDWLFWGALIALAFYLGMQRGRRGGGGFNINIVKILVGFVAVALSFVSLLGLLLFISPSLYVEVVQLLPREVMRFIEEGMITRWFLFGSTFSSLIFVGLTIGAWWLYARIDNSGRIRI
ncbi:hypothetical protein ABFB09_02705 [Dehalogenimonas sp. THU2]|uniref:hypothetical protein n=1 Tax=Dehalogenimonas sp. THU2 TaxID=3151121 RepID=UPI0032189619